MQQETSDLRHYPLESITANKDGYDMIKFMQQVRSSVATVQQRLTTVESENREWQAHRQKHLDLRQRALATWCWPRWKQPGKSEVRPIWRCTEFWALASSFLFTSWTRRDMLQRNFFMLTKTDGRRLLTHWDRLYWQVWKSGHRRWEQALRVFLLHDLSWLLYLSIYLYDKIKLCCCSYVCLE